MTNFCLMKNSSAEEEFENANGEPGDSGEPEGNKLKTKER